MTSKKLCLHPLGANDSGVCELNLINFEEKIISSNHFNFIDLLFN